MLRIVDIEKLQDLMDRNVSVFSLEVAKCMNGADVDGDMVMDVNTGKQYVVNYREKIIKEA